MKRVRRMVVSGVASLALSAPALAGTFLVGSGSGVDLGTGSLALGCADLDVAGTFSAGTVGFTDAGDVRIAPGGVVNGDSATLEVSGDWENASSFVPGASTVRIVDGCGLSGVISGDTTFHYFELSSTSGRLASFAAGSTQTVTGGFDASGTTGNLLRLRSTAAGMAAFLNVQGTGSVAYVDVDDIHALGNPIALGPDSILGPNTPGWVRAAAIPLLTPLAGVILLGALIVVGYKRLAST